MGSGGKNSARRHKARNDRCVQVAVAVAALQSAAGISRTLESGIDITAGKGRIARTSKGELVGRCRNRRVDAAVGKVYRESRSVKLSLCNILTRKIGEVVARCRGVAG